jgi:hypothetical protein
VRNVFLGDCGPRFRACRRLCHGPCQRGRTAVKDLRIIVLLVSSAMLSACGGGTSTSSTVTGNWTATLSNRDSSPAFAFTTSLNQTSGSTSVNVTALSFTTSTSCFSSGTTGTGSFALSGNFNGQTQGAYQMTVQSVTPSDNLLTLQGTAKDKTISGTLTLAGATGCSGNENFVMNKS